MAKMRLKYLERSATSIFSATKFIGVIPLDDYHHLIRPKKSLIGEPSRSRTFSRPPETAVAADRRRSLGPLLVYPPYQKKGRALCVRAPLWSRRVYISPPGSRGLSRLARTPRGSWVVGAQSLSPGQRPGSHRRHLHSVRCQDNCR